MTTPKIAETILPKIASLEQLQLRSYYLRDQPENPIHLEVEKQLVEVFNILKNIPAFHFPLHYGGLARTLSNLIIQT